MEDYDEDNVFPLDGREGVSTIVGVPLNEWQHRRIRLFPFESGPYPGNHFNYSNDGGVIGICPDSYVMNSWDNYPTTQFWGLRGADGAALGNNMPEDITFSILSLGTGHGQTSTQREGTLMSPKWSKDYTESDGSPLIPLQARSI